MYLTKANINIIKINFTQVPFFEGLGQNSEFNLNGIVNFPYDQKNFNASVGVMLSRYRIEGSSLNFEISIEGCYEDHLNFLVKKKSGSLVYELEGYFIIVSHDATSILCHIFYFIDHSGFSKEKISNFSNFVGLNSIRDDYTAKPLVLLMPNAWKLNTLSNNSIMPYLLGIGMNDSRPFLNFYQSIYTGYNSSVADVFLFCSNGLDCVTEHYYDIITDSVELYLQDIPSKSGGLSISFNVALKTFFNWIPKYAGLAPYEIEESIPGILISKVNRDSLEITVDFQYGNPGNVKVKYICSDTDQFQIKYAYWNSFITWNPSVNDISTPNLPSPIVTFSLTRYQFDPTAPSPFENNIMASVIQAPVSVYLRSANLFLTQVEGYVFIIDSRFQDSYDIFYTTNFVNNLTSNKSYAQLFYGLQAIVTYISNGTLDQSYMISLNQTEFNNVSSYYEFKSNLQNIFFLIGFQPKPRDTFVMNFNYSTSNYMKVYTKFDSNDFPILLITDRSIFDGSLKCLDRNSTVPQILLIQKFLPNGEINFNSMSVYINGTGTINVRRARSNGYTVLAFKNKTIETYPYISDTEDEYLEVSDMTELKSKLASPMNSYNTLMLQFAYEHPFYYAICYMRFDVVSGFILGLYTSGQNVYSCSFAEGGCSTRYNFGTMKDNPIFFTLVGHNLDIRNISIEDCTKLTTQVGGTYLPTPPINLFHFTKFSNLKISIDFNNSSPRLCDPNCLKCFHSLCQECKEDYVLFVNSQCLPFCPYYYPYNRIGKICTPTIEPYTGGSNFILNNAMAYFNVEIIPLSIYKSKEFIVLLMPQDLMSISYPIALPTDANYPSLSMTLIINPNITTYENGNKLIAIEKNLSEYLSNTALSKISASAYTIIYNKIAIGKSHPSIGIFEFYYQDGLNATLNTPGYYYDIEFYVQCDRQYFLSVEFLGYIKISANTTIQLIETNVAVKTKLDLTKRLIGVTLIKAISLGATNVFFSIETDGSYRIFNLERLITKKALNFTTAPSRFCSISGCVACNSTECFSCIPGYYLSPDGSSCGPTCPANSYATFDFRCLTIAAQTAGYFCSTGYICLNSGYSLHVATTTTCASQFCIEMKPKDMYGLNFTRSNKIRAIFDTEVNTAVLLVVTNNGEIKGDAVFKNPSPLISKVVKIIQLTSSVTFNLSDVYISDQSSVKFSYIKVKNEYLYVSTYNESYFCNFPRSNTTGSYPSQYSYLYVTGPKNNNTIFTPTVYTLLVAYNNTNADFTCTLQVDLVSGIKTAIFKNSEFLAEGDNKINTLNFKANEVALITIIGYNFYRIVPNFKKCNFTSNGSSVNPVFTYFGLNSTLSPIEYSVSVLANSSSCSADCISCYSIEKCLECIPGKYLMNGTCVHICPYYQVPILGKYCENYPVSYFQRISIDTQKKELRYKGFVFEKFSGYLIASFLSPLEVGYTNYPTIFTRSSNNQFSLPEDFSSILKVNISDILDISISYNFSFIFTSQIRLVVYTCIKDKFIFALMDQSQEYTDEWGYFGMNESLFNNMVDFYRIQFHLACTTVCKITADYDQTAELTINHRYHYYFPTSSVRVQHTSRFQFNGTYLINFNFKGSFNFSISGNYSIYAQQHFIFEDWLSINKSNSCSILNCDSCKDNITCFECRYPYVLSFDGTQCIENCESNRTSLSNFCTHLYNYDNKICKAEISIPLNNDSDCSNSLRLKLSSAIIFEGIRTKNDDLSLVGNYSLNLIAFVLFSQKSLPENRFALETGNFYFATRFLTKSQNLSQAYLPSFIISDPAIITLNLIFLNPEYKQRNKLALNGSGNSDSFYYLIEHNSSQALTCQLEIESKQGIISAIFINSEPILSDSGKSKYSPNRLIYLSPMEIYILNIQAYNISSLNLSFSNCEDDHKNAVSNVYFEFYKYQSERSNLTIDLDYTASSTFCPANCLTCKNSTYCLRCNVNNVVYEGKCYDLCPSQPFFFPSSGLYCHNSVQFRAQNKNFKLLFERRLSYDVFFFDGHNMTDDIVIFFNHFISNFSNIPHLEPTTFGLSWTHISHKSTPNNATLNCIVRTIDKFFDHECLSLSNLDPTITDPFIEMVAFSVIKNKILMSLYESSPLISKKLEYMEQIPPALNKANNYLFSFLIDCIANCYLNLVFDGNITIYYNQTFLAFSSYSNSIVSKNVARRLYGSTFLKIYLNDSSFFNFTLKGNYTLFSLKELLFTYQTGSNFSQSCSQADCGLCDTTGCLMSIGSLFLDLTSRTVVSSCPTHSFANIESKICQCIDDSFCTDPAFSHCNVEYGTCEECVSDDQCNLIYQPPQIFTKCYNNACLKCATNCTSCSAPSICDICIEGYEPMNGTCSMICTEEQYKISLTECIQSSFPTFKLKQFGQYLDKIMLTFDRDMRTNATIIKEAIFMKLDKDSPSDYDVEIVKKSDKEYEITVLPHISLQSQWVAITFINRSKVIDEHGIKVTNQTENLKIIPILTQSVFRAIESVNKVGGTLMNAATGASSFLVVFSSNPSLLWLIISMVQNYYYLSFYSVNYPFNLEEFLKFYKIATLNIFPNIFSSLSGAELISENSIQSPANFGKQNVDSLFLASAGSNISLLMLFIFGYAIGFLFVKYTRNILPSFKSKIHEQMKKFKWSGAVRIYSGFFLNLVIYVSLQILTVVGNTPVQVISVIVAILFGIMHFFLIYGSYYLVKNFHRPIFHKHKSQFGYLHKEFKTENAGKYAIVISFIKRFLFGSALVFFCRIPHLQILFCIFINILYILYLIRLKPFKLMSNNASLILDEALFLLASSISFGLFITDDWNIKQDIRINIGWYIIGLSLLNILINLGVSIVSQVKNLITKLKSHKNKAETSKLKVRRASVRKIKRKIQIR